MYQIENEITLDYLSKLLQNFNMTKRISLDKYEKYYLGSQDIMNKTTTDPSKPNNKIVTNYCQNIVDNYKGYLVGKDIAYISNDDIEDIQSILNYNDVSATDAELLENALIYGVGYEVMYVDEDKQTRFKILNSKECIPIYDNTLNNNLKYIIRYYPENTIDDIQSKNQMVEIYTNDSIMRYRASDGFKNFKLIEETKHYFHQVPVNVFNLNKHEKSVFDCIITLQDAYNNLLSSEVDDFQAFCDAYLVLTGVQADIEDIAMMKENRVLLLDENSKAEYLSKSITDTQIENMLRNINDNIHKIANSPDFNDEKLMAQSGIAMMYKLIGFENQASAIEKNMTKVLQKRFELITQILAIKGDDTWRDIEIVFTRNLPANTLEVAQQINMLRGLVSDETLISQLPFITDIGAELERLQAAKAMQPAYQFGE